jgi:hypothetical protein
MSLPTGARLGSYEVLAILAPRPIRSPTALVHGAYERLTAQDRVARKSLPTIGFASDSHTGMASCAGVAIMSHNWIDGQRQSAGQSLLAVSTRRGGYEPSRSRLDRVSDAAACDNAHGGVDQNANRTSTCLCLSAGIGAGSISGQLVTMQSVRRNLVGLIEAFDVAPIRLDEIAVPTRRGA